MKRLLLTLLFVLVTACQAEDATSIGYDEDFLMSWHLNPTGSCLPSQQVTVNAIRLIVQ